MMVGPHRPSFLTGLSIVLLTSLLVGTANAMNCVIERDVDALMLRTQIRPLPAGHMTVFPAALFSVLGACFAVIGIAVLSNALTACLGALGYLSYVVLYTPLKQKTPWALIVGAVPGAIPPLMGWTASNGTLGAQGLALFSLLFVWQIPHFLAIALCERFEYARAGIKVLPLTHGLPVTYRAIRISAVLTGFAMLAPYTTGIAGHAYGIVASLLALHFIGVTWFSPKSDAMLRPWAVRIFRTSVIDLTILMVLLVLDH